MPEQNTALSQPTAHGRRSGVVKKGSESPFDTSADREKEIGRSLSMEGNGEEEGEERETGRVVE